jgi:hypothetical protein
VGFTASSILHLVHNGLLDLGVIFNLVAFCFSGIQITLLCQVGSDLACQNASSATISIVKVGARIIRFSPML